MPFKGTPAPGGARKGAGRKPDKFKAAVARIGDPLKVIEFFWRVSQGIEKDHTLDQFGHEIAVEASLKDRMKAGELFLERTIGKVPTKVEDADGNKIALLSVIGIAEKERGLSD